MAPVELQTTSSSQLSGTLQANALKYIARYAEPEARLRLELNESYDSAIVVPAYDERKSFVQGLSPALLGQNSLLILVVNATSIASAGVHATNQALVDHLLDTAKLARQLRSSPPIFWLRYAGYDVLLLDRAAPGYLLPDGQGVGLARRIGADVALALKLSGTITARGFGCSDADVRLPSGYFRAAERALVDAEAAVLPFAHEPTEDVQLSTATAAYELSLRFLVLGLDYAGSSYAYHSLGSSLYPSFGGYASVRGFPKRQAGEDFYLLDKLAKLGRIRRLTEPTIQIRSRHSARVPFGTGPRVRQLLERCSDTGVLTLYHPDSFRALRELLRSFTHFAHTRDIGAMRRYLLNLPAGEQMVSHLEKLNFERALASAAAQTSRTEQLARRLATWFDALRTLKFIHALRDSCYPELGWQRAIEMAEFVPSRAKRTLVESDVSSAYFEVLQALRAHERTLPEPVGVACADP